MVDSNVWRLSKADIGIWQSVSSFRSRQDARAIANWRSSCHYPDTFSENCSLQEHLPGCAGVERAVRWRGIGSQCT